MPYALRVLLRLYCDTGHHLRRPVTLTPVEELLAKELSIIGFTTCVCRSWGSNTQSAASEEKNRILQIFLVENKVLHTYLEK